MACVTSMRHVSYVSYVSYVSDMQVAVSEPSRHRDQEEGARKDHTAEEDKG
jgi:hypothetical protein